MDLNLRELPIAQLGYGCMRFPVDGEGRIDQTAMNALIARAMEGGITYYDTAWPYHMGQSEPCLAEALKPYPRDSYQLATKLPCWSIKSAEQAVELVGRQLNRLQTDYVDYYLLHALNGGTWRRMVDLGVIEALEGLQTQGKIKNFGFSFHDAYEVFEEIIRYRKWDFCQIQLNYLDTRHQAGLRGYQLAAELDVPLVIMEPLKGGMLTQLPDHLTRPMTQLAPERSLAYWGLGWLASLPNVKVILSGMTTMEQLEDNLSIFDGIQPLSDQEQGAVAETSQRIQSQLKNGCTACCYCIPCPVGVDIPGNFRVWNAQAVSLDRADVTRIWRFLDVGERGDQCIGCGKCEALCPQMIPIRAHLKQASLDIAAYFGQG